MNSFKQRVTFFFFFPLVVSKKFSLLQYRNKIPVIVLMYLCNKS